jgi:ketosteroid isomerase-like protein
MQITISDRDAAVLRGVLDARLVELRREISHTDSPRFRNTLHEVEDVLERLIAQLPPTRGDL